MYRALRAENADTVTVESLLAVARDVVESPTGSYPTATTTHTGGAARPRVGAPLTTDLTTGRVRTTFTGHLGTVIRVAPKPARYRR